MVSDMLLLGCSWFKYRFIKLDLVTVGKFDSVDVNFARTQRTRGEPWLVCAQNVCALTKVSSILNIQEKGFTVPKAISQIVSGKTFFCLQAPNLASKMGR